MCKTLCCRAKRRRRKTRRSLLDGELKKEDEKEGVTVSSLLNKVWKASEKKTWKELQYFKMYPREVRNWVRDGRTPRGIWTMEGFWQSAGQFERMARGIEPGGLTVRQELFGLSEDWNAWREAEQEQEENEEAISGNRLVGEDAELRAQMDKQHTE